MNYPLISEYIESIKLAEDNFEELNYLRPVLDDTGQPVMSSGNFAVVFKMKDERDGKLYAVRCFHRDQEGRADSYRLIEEELKDVESPYLVSFRYMDKELFVDSSQTGETEFPVLLMDWVEGKTLDVYIKENINNQYALDIFAYQFGKLSAWLLTQPFAHGDLKPDNILIKEDGLLVLVDYDGMYVPTMRGQKARELGSPGFRHPSRTEDNFDEHIDDFPIASISLSLKAIALAPSLWNKYGGNDKLLFTENDYCDLSNSQCLSDLQPLMIDRDFCLLYGVFMIAWAKNDLSSPSYRLLNMTKVQKEDIQAVVSLYQKGVKYVEDKKYEEAYNIFCELAKTGNSQGIQMKGVAGKICGSVLGENGLGYMCAYGLYVERDEKEAFSWFRKAARKDFALARFNLGICYEKGFGVMKDHKKAEHFFKLAAEQKLGLATSYYYWMLFPEELIEMEDEYNEAERKALISKFYL